MDQGITGKQFCDRCGGENEIEHMFTSSNYKECECKMEWGIDCGKKSRDVTFWVDYEMCPKCGPTRYAIGNPVECKHCKSIGHFKNGTPWSGEDAEAKKIRLLPKIRGSKIFDDEENRI